MIAELTAGWRVTERGRHRGDPGLVGERIGGVELLPRGSVGGVIDLSALVHINTTPMQTALADPQRAAPCRDDRVSPLF